MALILWEPSDTEKFWELVEKRVTYKDIGREFGTTKSQVKNYVGRIRRASTKEPGNVKNPYVDLKNKFLAFLQKAKTIAEIHKVFGEHTDKLLADSYEGMQIYKQVNHLNQVVHILLPVPQDEIKLQPRRLIHYKSLNEQGKEQPYLLVNIPDDIIEKYGQIDIIPLYDVHRGHSAHKHEKFLAYIRYIQETPNVFGFIGGDLMDNALDDGRGMTYDNDENPDTQLWVTAKMLAPIAHKLIVALPGNHELRTYHHAGIDPMKVLAEKLGIPYFDGPVYISVVTGGFKWKFYVSHGYGSSTTKGGKMNRANGPKKFLDFVHFIVSGHVHDPICNPETCVMEDPVNNRLVYPQQWTIIAPSFLWWENTYAYRSGYGPPGSGGVVCRLYANGQHDATLT